MFFFSFFAVLHVCSISFYNFFGLAVTKSLTGKGGKNCLIFSYTKGLIVLFCAPFTHLCPRMPCAYVRWLPQFFASSSLLAHKLFCFLLLFLLSYSSWALPQIQQRPRLIILQMKSLFVSLVGVLQRQKQCSQKYNHYRIILELLLWPNGDLIHTRGGELIFCLRLISSRLN